MKAFVQRLAFNAARAAIPAVVRVAAWMRALFRCVS